MAAAEGFAVASQPPADAELVVLAGPLDTFAATMAEVGAAAPTATIIDVGSVKVAPARAALAAGIADRYVGCHPMSGTELSGWASSDPELLVDVTWAVTHGTGPVADVVAWVLEAFEATVVVLEASEHDRAVALVSHAPHAIANALLAVVESAETPSAALLAAGSFRDGTRVAGRNAARTFNMIIENADALAPALDAVIAELQAYRADLADPAALRARVEQVSAAAESVRDPQLRWSRHDDLHAVVVESAASGRAVVVRAPRARLRDPLTLVLAVRHSLEEWRTPTASRSPSVPWPSRWR